MEIICLGEALIDFKAVGELAFQGYPGGSPFNVAVAASRLGNRVGFASQVSTDMFGTEIMHYMRENGIETDYVLRSDAPSTLAFVSEQGGDAHFSFFADGAADRRYDPIPRPEFPSSVRYLMFGSISLLSEPAATAIAETVKGNKDRVMSIFDPNVRPALIPDRQRYLENLKAWLDLASIVKTSVQDLDWLYPGRAVDTISEEWMSHGSQAVIVTRGSEGAILFHADRSVHEVPSPRVSVADTVGAGDTFTGAFMVALAERSIDDFREVGEKEAQELLSFSVTAAALTCSRQGADPPNRKEVDKFLSAVR